MKNADSLPDTALASPAFSRRQLLGGALGLASATALPAASALAKPKNFSFVHITDLHIQTELGAAKGVARAFAAVKSLKEKPAFALIGGDLVMDAAYVDRKRADEVYDLWQAAAADLKLPLYYSVGNHDLYAIGKDGANAKTGDPDYGKRLWMKRLNLTRTFGSFDHEGWRFVTLDSVALTPGALTPGASGSGWEGSFSPEQITFLDDLLRQTPRTTPLVFLTHIPVMTLFAQYTEGTTAPLSGGLAVKNGKSFFDLIQNHNVKAVLQGHTHVVENCAYRGTQYITGGAVCGEWWRGPRLGVHPEGFGVLTVRGDDLTYRYQPYGWNATTSQS